MKELEIYLPSVRNDGQPVALETIELIKLSLMNAFGGYTHLKARCEGVWKMGGVVFRDEVTIIRVLENLPTGFDMQAFRRNVEAMLDQEKILVVVREVAVLD